MVNSIEGFRKVKIYTHNCQASIHILINIIHNINKCQRSRVIFSESKLIIVQDTIAFEIGD